VHRLQDALETLCSGFVQDYDSGTTADAHEDSKALTSEHHAAYDRKEHDGEGIGARRKTNAEMVVQLRFEQAGGFGWRRVIAG
jgi:hypothetical protein